MGKVKHLKISTPPDEIHCTNYHDGQNYNESYRGKAKYLIGVILDPVLAAF